MRDVATLRKISAGMIVAFARAPQGKASHVPAQERRRPRGELRGVIPTLGSTNVVKPILGAWRWRRSPPPALPSDSLRCVKSSLQNARFYKVRAGWSHNETFSKVTGCVVRTRPIRPGFWSGIALVIRSRSRRGAVHQDSTRRENRSRNWSTFIPAVAASAPRCCGSSKSARSRRIM